MVKRGEAQQGKEALNLFHNTPLLQFTSPSRGGAGNTALEKQPIRLSLKCDFQNKDTDACFTAPDPEASPSQ